MILAEAGSPGGPGARIVYVNPAFTRSTGYRADEVMGRSPGFLQTSRTSPDELKRIAGAIAAGEAAHTAVIHRRKDGTDHPVRLTLSPLRDEGGRLTHLVTRLRDDLGEADALGDSEARFRSVIEAMPDALMVCDGQGRLLIVNEQTERLFGYAAAELLGQPVEMLIPARFRVTHAGYHASFTEGPGNRRMGGGRALRGLRRDGTEVLVEVSLNTVAQSGGVVTIAVARDVTERTRVDEAVRQERDAQVTTAQAALRESEERYRVSSRKPARPSYILQTRGGASAPSSRRTRRRRRCTATPSPICSDEPDPRPGAPRRVADKGGPATSGRVRARPVAGDRERRHEQRRHPLPRRVLGGAARLRRGALHLWLRPRRHRARRAGRGAARRQATPPTRRTTPRARSSPTCRTRSARR